MRNCLLRILTVFLSVCIGHTFSSGLWAGTHVADATNLIAEDGQIIYGYSISTRANGAEDRSIVSIDLETGVEIDTPVDSVIVGGNPRMISYFGGGYYAEGYYYPLVYVNTGMSFIAQFATYSTSDWSLNGSGNASIRYPAYDSTSDDVYGVAQYVTGQLQRFEGGSTRSSSSNIGMMDHTPVTLVVDKEGTLYSVSSDAKLYKVSKTDASSEEIGSLGITFLSNRTYDTMGAIFGDDSSYFYFAAEVTEDGQNTTTGLYKVSTATGQASLMYNFPEKKYYVGLFFDDGQINDLAPGQATDISFDPVEGALKEGYIKFTVPTTTYGGESLTGNVAADIYFGGDFLQRLTDLTPGEEAVTTMKAVSSQSGEGRIRIVLSNSYGQGPNTNLSQWVGYGYPNPVQNLSVIIDEETGYPLISWNLPKEGTNNSADAEVDLSKVVYRISRISDVREVVEQEFWLEAAGDDFLFTYLDNDPQLKEGSQKAYYYIVNSILDNLEGGHALTTTSADGFVKLGDPYTVPFYLDFSIAGSSTPEYAQIGGAAYVGRLCNFFNPAAEYTWSTNSSGMTSPAISTGRTLDNWFYTPPISLTGGIYSLDYVVNPGTTWPSSGLFGTYEVYITKNVTPSDDDILIAVVDDYENSNYNVAYNHTFNLEEDGVYYIAYYVSGVVNSTEDSAVRINKISLELLAAEGAPAEVTDLTLSGSLTGSLNPITISFKLPTTNAIGEELEEITGYRVYKNGELLRDVADNFEPGESISLMDYSVDEGNWIYGVSAYNRMGESLRIEENIFVGFDMPKAVANPTLSKDPEGNAVITWEYSEGVHGGYVEVELLRFRITRTDGLGNVVVVIEDHQIDEEEIETEHIPGSGMGGVGTDIVVGYKTTYVDNKIEKEGQNVYSYLITPYYVYDEENEAASISTNKFRFGDPHAFPFNESFANANYSSTGWTVEKISGEAAEGMGWKLYDADNEPEIAPLDGGTQDGDDGMAVFYVNLNVYDFVERIASPTVATEGMDVPMLEFWFYHSSSISAQYGNRTLSVLAAGDDEEFEELLEVKLYSLDKLGKPLEGWVRYRVDLTNYKEGEFLQVAFEGESTTASRSNNSLAIDNVNIINRPDYDLELSVLSAPTNVIAGGYVNEINISVTNLGGKTVEDYTIEVYKDGEVFATLPGVELKMLETATFNYEFIPSLEEAGNSYELYAVVKLNEGEDSDEDNNTSLEVIKSYVLHSIYPTVLELNGVGGDENIALEWDAVAPKMPVIDQSLSPNSWDKKITSPKLNGAKQTLRFNSTSYSYGAFKVYVAFTEPEELVIDEKLTEEEKEALQAAWEAKDDERFVEIEVEDIENPDAANGEYSFVLAEESKYFQIRVDKETTVYFTDFFFAVEGEEDANVLGYNIYRDGEKINTEVVTGTTYVDNHPNQGANSYKLTVVYEGDIQSNYSAEEVVTFTGTGINGVELLISVYTTAGAIVIEGAEELPINVITINGTTVAVQIGTGSDVISVPSGIYLVKVAGKVVKVSVK